MRSKEAKMQILQQDLVKYSKQIGIVDFKENDHKPILSRSKELEEPQYQPLEPSDVKEIIHDVLQ